MPARDDRHPRSPHAKRRSPAAADASVHAPVHLEDDITRELRSTARPGKGDILVKVFAEAAGAFAVDDYDEAIRLGEQAKHLALRSIPVRELLGLAYYRAGRWPEAARELSAYRRMSGRVDQNPVLADTYRALRRPERAVELAREITPGAVSEPVAYEGAIVEAGALADLGELAAAIERIERLDLAPAVAEEHHLRAWYVLGDLLERKGRFTQARMLFEQVASADPDATDAPERATRLARSRRSD